MILLKKVNFIHKCILFFLILNIINCSSNCKSGDKPFSYIKNTNSEIIKITICREDNPTLKKELIINPNYSLKVDWPIENERGLNFLTESCATSENMRYTNIPKEVLLSSEDQANFNLCSNGYVYDKNISCPSGSILIEKNCDYLN